MELIFSTPLLKILDTPLCRADELSIRSISNEEYIPRWVKRDMKKLKTICCVCGCKDLAKRKSALSYYEICAACDVNPADTVVTAASSNSREFYICDRHYSALQRYCGQESTIECALCGGKPKHIVGSIRYGHHLDPFLILKPSILYSKKLVILIISLLLIVWHVTSAIYFVRS